MTAAHGKAKRALVPTERVHPVSGDPDWHAVTVEYVVQVSTGALYATTICACGLRDVTIYKARPGFHAARKAKP